jgi:hypothetical protein
MIDLTDYGYTDYQLTAIDPGGAVDGALGGPSDFIDRPGYRYSMQFTLPPLPSAKEARIFQSMLEQGARDDVSYPWPLDFKSVAAGSPKVNGASPAGTVIPIYGLPANYQFKQGQPVAVISEGIRFIHKATATISANGSGQVTLPVFPYTRKAFLNNDVIEVERPRIGGILNWQGAQQPSFGARPFTFTITERY